jgi:hypothetical protein
LLVAIAFLVEVPIVVSQTEVGILSIDPTYGTVSSAAIDTVNRFLYLGTYVTPNIIKVAISNFTMVAALPLGKDMEPRTLVADNAGFKYVFGGTRILKIRLSDFWIVANTTFTAPSLFLCCSYAAVIDPADTFAYVSAIAAENHAPYKTLGATIVKVRLSDLTVNGTLTPDPTVQQIYTAVLDPARGFAYFGTCWNPAKVLRVRLSDFILTDSLELHSGESCLGSSVIDPAAGFVYFGTWFGQSSKVFVPGIIVKIKLSDFSQVGDFTLPKADLGTAVIDPGRGYTYFGSGSNYPGAIFAIRLSDFTVANSLVLNQGESLEYAHGSAVIDRANGFVYFGAYSFVAKIGVIPLGQSSSTLTTATSTNHSIPAFPYESMVIGLVFGLTILIALRRRRFLGGLFRF